MRVDQIWLSICWLAFSAWASTADYTSSGSDWATGSCSSGSRQSPINIEKSDVTDNTDVTITASMNDITSGTIHHDANNLKVTYTNGTLAYKSDIETSTWNVAQFHFHAPSEHTINNVSYAMEMHTVFTLSTNSSIYLVVGILFESDTNAEDDSFITSLNLTSVAGSTNTITNVSMSDLSDWVNSKKKYNYKGGLTTPTCDEAVEWMVVTEAKKINAVQLALYTSLWADNSTFAGGNGSNRAIQATNRREVQLIGAGDGDWNWVWPVVSVLIVLTVISIGTTLVVIIWYNIQMRRQDRSTSRVVSDVPNALNETKHGLKGQVGHNTVDNRDKTMIQPQDDEDQKLESIPHPPIENK
jgi:carbonic anhydrase